MALTQHECFFKKESSWGTGVDVTTPTTGALEVLGVTGQFSYKVDNVVGAVNPASSAYPTEISYHEAKVSGSIDLIYQNAMPFVPMLGSVTAKDPVEVSGPYTWTIAPSATAAPFTTSIFVNGTNDKEAQLLGCQATSLSFAMKAGGPVTGKLDFVAKGIDIANNAFTAPTTITLDDAEAWNPKDFTYAIGSVSGITYITDFEFTIKRTADVGYGLAARLPVIDFPGKFEAVTGSFSAWIQDAATANELEQLVLGGTTVNETLTPQDIVLDYKTYTDTTADTAKITINDAIIQSVDATFPLDTKHLYKFNFSAESVNPVVWESPIAVSVGAW
jgi:hypothetical protein